MTEQLLHGKKTIHESYFNGEMNCRKVSYSIHTLIKTKAEALTEIMKALELISARKTPELTITIKTDPKTNDFKLITKTYLVEE